MKFNGLMSASTLAIALVAAPAFAQQVSTPTTSTDGTPTEAQPNTVAGTTPDGATSDRDASEIIVTARKRAESLQDVPLSVAVISGTRLQEQNINSIESLGQVTAGFVYRRTPNNLPNLTLRGLGTGTAVDAYEQSVAAFIDGTYAGRGPEFNAALFDFDRIEVIRGAQASLLSKNTSLGAISLATRKPGDRFKADVVASYEFELNSKNIEAGVDVPLSDTLKVRVAGKYDDQGGYVNDLTFGNKVPSWKSYAGRVVAVFNPTDNIDITGMYQHYNTKTIGIPWEGYNDPTGQINSLNVLAGYNGFETNVDRSKAEGGSFGQTYDKTHGNRAVGTINFNFGEGFTLTSVSAYSDFVQRRYRDTDFQVGDYLNSFYTQANHQYQQEIRLSSPAEGQFVDYVVGGSYFHEKWFFSDYNIARCTGCSALQLSRFAQRGAFATRDLQKTTDWAAFGQVNLHFTDTLTASGGVRYTNEKRNATMSRTLIEPGAYSQVVYNPFAPITLRRKENNVDGSIGLNWKPRSDLLVYTAYSKGTKSGGFLNIATNPTTPAGRIAAEYDNEIAHTFEIGEKLSLPNGGFFNVTFFRTDIKGFQQAIYVNPNYLTTARDLRSQGVEIESGIQLLPGLRAQGQVAYANTRRKDAGHFAPPGAPKWTGNATLTLRQPVNDDITFTGDVGAEFRTQIFLTDENLTQGFGGNFTTLYTPRGQGYYFINARAGIKSTGGWELALVGKNLNNKLVYNYAVAYSLIGPGAYVMTNQPRTIALQASFHY